MLHLKEAEAMLDGIRSPNFRRLLAEVIEKVDSLLESLEKDQGVRPLVAGGLATQRHGHVRYAEDLVFLVSPADFAALSAAGKVGEDRVLVDPQLRVMILVSGEGGVPRLEDVADGASRYPTLEGLIWLNLISPGYFSLDKADIIQLLKRHLQDEALVERVRALVPEDSFELFLRLLALARFEVEYKTLPPTPRIK